MADISTGNLRRWL